METQRKAKRKSKPKAKRSRPSGEGGVPSLGEDSDGLTALKAVEEEERGEVKRGPPSASRTHWHPPRKHMEPGSRTLRWKFKCRYCNKYVSAPPQRASLICSYDHIYTLGSSWPERGPSNEPLDATISMTRGLSPKSATLALTPAPTIRRNTQEGLTVPSSCQQIPSMTDTHQPAQSSWRSFS